MPALEAPEDRTITTLYVGNIGENTTEDELRLVNAAVRWCNLSVIASGKKLLFGVGGRGTGNVLSVYFFSLGVIKQVC